MKAVVDKESDDKKIVDGRFLRRERSRQRIVDAMIGLIRQGEFLPTAQQVADASQVSIRSVFRQFSDMEQLYLEIDGVMRPSYEAHFRGLDRSGDLAQRISRVVERLVTAYSDLYAEENATMSLAWRSEAVKRIYNRNQSNLRTTIETWLPEIRALPNDEREALHAFLSFQYYERLHRHQSLSDNACKTLIINLVRGLFNIE